MKSIGLHLWRTPLQEEEEEVDEEEDNHHENSFEGVLAHVPEDR